MNTCQILSDGAFSFRRCGRPAAGMDAKGVLVCCNCGQRRQMSDRNPHVGWFDEKWKRKAPELEKLLTESYRRDGYRPQGWLQICEDNRLKLRQVICLDYVNETPLALKVVSVGDDAIKVILSSVPIPEHTVPEVAFP